MAAIHAIEIWARLLAGHGPGLGFARWTATRVGAVALCLPLSGCLIPWFGSRDCDVTTSAQAGREQAQNFIYASDCPAPLAPPPAAATDIVPARLAAGGGYSIVIKADGSLRSWGDALPEGDVPSLPGAAVGVGGGHGRDTSGGPYAVGSAVLADGTVLSWGGATPAVPAASVLSGFGKMRQMLACGGLSSSPVLYGLAPDGKVWTDGYSSTPQPLPGVTGVRLLGLEGTAETGACQPLLILGDGSVRTVAAFAGGTQPLVAGLPAMQQVRCEMAASASLGRHCVGLSEAGQVWTWGDNGQGQLGDGTTTGRTAPQVVTGLEQVVAIATLPGQSLALKSNGELFTWGAPVWLARDAALTPANLPGRVEGLPPIAEIATGEHILARGTDGSVWSWGPNARGELGTGDRLDRPLPAQVPGLNVN